MSTTTATPTPWRRDGSQIGPHGEHIIYIVGGEAGQHPTIFISSLCHTQEEIEQFEANVDLILKAVNLFDRVKRVVKSAFQWSVKRSETNRKWSMQDQKIHEELAGVNGEIDT